MTELEKRESIDVARNSALQAVERAMTRARSVYQWLDRCRENLIDLKPGNGWQDAPNGGLMPNAPYDYEEVKDQAEAILNWKLANAYLTALEELKTDEYCENEDDGVEGIKSDIEVADAALWRLRALAEEYALADDDDADDDADDDDDAEVATQGADASGNA